MPARRAQSGIALVTAVMIVAIAAAIAVQIAFAHQIWFRQMENVADRDATDWLRRGALHWASLALLEDAAQNSTDHLGESWAMGLPTLPVEGGTIKVSIEDAQSRFNLNSIGGTDPTSLANLQLLQRLLDVLQLDPQLANAVADWIDPNSDARAGGAEDIDYLNLNPPYRAANRPMASVDELRLIRGFDAKTVAALLPYVTVLPAVTNDINVNTASPVVLDGGNGREDRFFPGCARHFDRAPRAPQRSAASTLAQQDHDCDLAQAATPDRRRAATLERIG